MAKRIKLGDIFEIPTKRGLFYAQYTHKVPSWGALIRVMSQSCQERPETFEQTVLGEELFKTFFPLQSAVNQDIFKIVSNTSIVDSAKEFPLFRAAGCRDKNGKVKIWWLWDGQNEWKLKKLSKEQRKLSIRQIMNDTALIQRIEDGWTSEQEY